MNRKFSLEEIINYFKEINPNKSASTYTTMKYNLIRISKLGQIEFSEIDATTITPENIAEGMSKYSVNSQIQTILGIQLWIKYKLVKLENGSKKQIDSYNLLKGKWDIQLRELCNTKNKRIEENQMTEKEKANWIDYEELRQKWTSVVDDKLKDDNKYNKISMESFNMWRDITLTSLFILIPPTRIGNYEKMRIRYKKTNDATALKRDRNYLMVDEDAGIFEKTGKYKYTLCFNQYKTAKHIGQVSEGISSTKLIQIFDRYLEQRVAILPINKYKFQETDTLFINGDSKKQLTQAYITEKLKKTTDTFVGKKLSCDMFRKIFLTWFLADNEKSIAQRKEMARFIGQTYKPTIMETYKKITLNKNIPIKLDFS